ncbi:polycystin-1-like protein 1 [Antennarius striatus]|uniref:polycystin-1-like protein 1 n=1 Tax=Antennarius striatus TaxID=241820 RepID=UPI0035B223DA
MGLMSWAERDNSSLNLYCQPVPFQLRHNVVLGEARSKAEGLHKPPSPLSWNNKEETAQPLPASCSPDAGPVGEDDSLRDGNSAAAAAPSSPCSGHVEYQPKSDAAWFATEESAVQPASGQMCLDPGFVIHTDAPNTFEASAMLGVFVYALISLQPFFHCVSDAAPEPVRENSPWFFGCVNASSGLFSPTALRDLDPVACSVLCLDEGVQVGKNFVVKVSGNLAGLPVRPTGIAALEGVDFSYVTIQIQEIPHKGQSSHHASVLDDNSFSVFSDWISESPGKFELRVSVSNPLSTLSSTLHLSVMKPSPPSLAISVLPGPLGVPSCFPFLLKDSIFETVGAVYLGDPVTLQADVGDSMEVALSWCFTHKGKRKNIKGVKTICIPSSARQNGTVIIVMFKFLQNWSFEIEGIHVVSVNASDVHGWTQETIDVMVVHPAFSDLRLGASGSQLTSVQIYTPKQAYPTNTDVTFWAVAEAPDPAEFLWDFGDSRSARTTARTITKRYHKPGRYDVVVVMSGDHTSRTSDVFPLVVQRAVRLNRLHHQPSVLLNQMVSFSCRVNDGTNVSFLWAFGDGPSKPGQSTEQHVFHRTGEFRVTVTASNLVSVASLSSHIFVVDRPCQPPPVKNMGPLKLQVRRHESVHLGVTYETEVDCDVSGGLSYTWTLFDSAGRLFPLPLIDTNKQSLTLPSYHLHYDTYTAIAKVQVVGTVVYSNYSVRVQVIPSPPIAFIQGGTNIFINNSNTTVVMLDGRRSHDPDFPMNPLSFNWTCKPVSSIASSCFHQDVQTSSSVLVFPASFLKDSFDQFHFTLNVHSLQRSASSEAYLTLTSDMMGKVLVNCPLCRGDQVNWEQPVSVSALCEDCKIEPQYIQYSWSLYRVNASSKPVTEVLFCYTVDVTAPSTIMEGQDTSSKIPATSTQHQPAVDGPQHNPAFYTSASVSLGDKTSGTSSKVQNLNVTDGGTSSKNSEKKNTYTKRELTPSLLLLIVLPEPDPSPISSLVHVRTATAEEPFYHPLGDFDPPELLYSPTEYQPLALDNSSVLHPGLSSQSDVISEFLVDVDSSADWEHSLPVWESGNLGGHQDWDYDIPANSPEEGDPGTSAGRPMAVESETFNPIDDSGIDPVILEDDEDEGSNLVDSRPSVVRQEPSLLDLSRDLVERGLLESYTYTGISSPSISFKPNSLQPGSRYMLEVRAESHKSLLGRTQLFLKTHPSPEGMTCQVQPMKGRELYTHFSIFCSSGKEDLLYEYSIRVGDGSPKILYQGRDFQYYFSLPSGDPTDDYKVTVYSKIRSSVYGTTTKPCPVTVQVQPSFFRDTSSSSVHRDPDLELSKSGLRNLSALVQLGNDVEVRNYISLLSSILNRLSMDTKANTHMQRHTRNALICTMCELENRDQASMLDSICLLRSLLQVTSQESRMSAGQVTHHVQVTTERFSSLYSLDQKVLDTLVALLSYSLQAAVTTLKPSNGCISESFSGGNFSGGESNAANQVVLLVADILQVAADLMLKYVSFHEAQEHRVSTGFMALYVAYQNQTSTIITSKSTSINMTSSLLQLLFDFRMRESRPDRPCVISMLTELIHSPYTWARYHHRLTGPVVDLSLYECSTKRKIPVRSLVQPIEFILQPPARSKSSIHEYILHCNKINYHSFNVTQEHLQQTIKLSVAFTPLLKKAFPIMLLFRMFEKPTPSRHHLRRIYHWESNTTQFILPSFYLNAPGVGHLALLYADFEKVRRHTYMSERVSYSLTMDSSLCLSWDDRREAWTHHGCRTWQEDTATTVNCSCRHLRPLTVVQQPIQTSHEETSLEPLLSVSSDLTVLCVLMLCVCLYIPGLVACKRADVISEENRRVHYLSDNSPHDPYLYAVTIHTGPCSAACMTAKVYLTLNGEEGVSPTKELQVPGCTLFRRNSQDTFIFSTAESLGPLWGVHIWHDNSGPSSIWYLKQVKVSEVSGGRLKGRAWLFLAQCWLAVNKGDGQVERVLQVCTQGIGFAKMLHLKLLDYFSDYHLWISVLRCPCPSSFTHTQRLSVSLLLLFGYACVNAAIISQMDDLLPFDLGVIDVSAVSVTTGLLSVLAVLPAAAIISFLFRLGEVKLIGSGIQHTKGNKTETVHFEEAPSVTSSKFQEVWRKKFQDTDLQSASSALKETKNTEGEVVIPACVFIRNEDALAMENNTRLSLQNLLLLPGGNNDQAPPDILSEVLRTQKSHLSSTWDGHQAIQENNSQGRRNDDSHHKSAWFSHSDHYHATKEPLSWWSHCVAWTLCLLLSVFCLVISAWLGISFSTSKVLLWMHSFFFSLILCIFLIQPAVIITVAVIESFWYRQRANAHIFSSNGVFGMETSQIRNNSGGSQSEETSAFPHEEYPNLEKLLGARRRARYLRLIRPPTPAELRKIRGKKIREAVLYKTLRDLSICLSMLILMLCINYGTSFTDHYRLNRAIKNQFISGGHEHAFMYTQKHDDWWKWTQSSLLNLLYKNGSAATMPYILIGEPVLWKTEASSEIDGWPSSEALLPEGLRLYLSGSRAFPLPQSNVLASWSAHPKTCGRLDCSLGPNAMYGFGHTRADAASKLRSLYLGGWLDCWTTTVAVRLTLFCPALSLFTSVTMVAEQSPTGVLIPSASVQSVRVHHIPGVWGYLVMICQVLFLILSLLQVCDHVSTVAHQGLVGYWRTPCIWLEVIFLTATSVYCICCIYHSSMVVKFAEVLQSQSHGGNVDVSLLATWEQYIHTMRGVMLFLLTMKSLALLRVNKTMATAATLLTRSLSSLLWPMISGLVLLVMMSCVINLLTVRSSVRFSSLSRSLQALLCLHWGPMAERGPHPSWNDILHSGVLHLSSTVVWTAVVIGVASSMVRGVKRSQRLRNVLTITQFIGYIRRRVFAVIWQRKKAWVEYQVEGKTYYFEEFENLMDELLFRLNALSNSLHHTPPPKSHHYTEGDSPVMTPIQDPSNMEDFVRTQVVQECSVHTDSDHEDILPACHVIQYKSEHEVLLQKGRREHNSPPDIVVASDNIQPITGDREHPNDREFQSSLKTQDYRSHPESASPSMVWTEDVLEKRVDQWTKKNDHCKLVIGQPNHSEVVVEVLVHNDNFSVKSDNQ